MTLFEYFDCSFDDEGLTGQSHQVTLEEADSFVSDVLTNPHRRMSVVVVTENLRGGIFLSPDYLQSRLLGLANVYTYDHDTAKAINKELSDWLRCWDGAIRVYRPGCSPADFSRQNVFWTWRRMGYILDSKGWEEFLIEVADECLIHSLPQAGPRLYDEVSGRIRQARYERLLEGFKSAADDESVYQGLLTDATATVEDYQRQNGELHERIRVLENENEQLRAQVEQLLTALSYQEPEPEDSPSDIRPEFDSVYDVVEYVKKSMDHIRLFSNAEQLAKGSQFPRLDEVYDNFSVLNECATQRNDGSLGKDIQEWLGERGVEYAAHESEATMGKYGKQRTFFDDVLKRQVQMPSHVKMGGGKGEHNQLRIHLLWEAKEKEWLVGYIGRHLPTVSG